MKNIVITDYDVPLECFKESVLVNLNNINFYPCTGDYSCLRKQTRCHYQDDLSYINQWINESTLVIFITHIYCGCIDNPLKSFIERHISTYEPFYSIVDGITCHASLTKHKKKILLIGYGNITTHEQDMLKDYLSDSLLGYTISSINTYFCKEDELEACLKTFGGIDRG